MSPPFTESVAEAAALEWLAELSYAVVDGSTIQPEKPAGEPACDSHADRRASFHETVLAERLREVVARLNPKIPTVAREEAMRKVLRSESAAPLSC